MAVPASGTLSLRGLGREKVYDNYNSASSLTNVSLQKLATSNGYDATNTNSASYPNATAPHGMNEWYSYDHDAAGSSSYYWNWYHYGYNTPSESEFHFWNSADGEEAQDHATGYATNSGFIYLQGGATAYASIYQYSGGTNSGNYVKAYQSGYITGDSTTGAYAYSYISWTVPYYAGYVNAFSY